jgi:NAD(P)-dependent dehydrogenase (short-subunit alcohol dehydrogenase family)
VDAAVPEAYRRLRAAAAGHVVSAIRDAGGRAASVEADLRDPGTPARQFDAAEAHLGAVDILINATGWVPDSFLLATRDRHGRSQLQRNLRNGSQGARTTRPGRSVKTGITDDDSLGSTPLVRAN